MRRFELVRHQDVSGVSGTGVVAWGVKFPDGKVATRWNPRGDGPAQTCCWDSIGDVRAVHGHGGSTEIRWLDDDFRADRLAVIARAHSLLSGAGGLTSGECIECGHHWPCPTYVWATSDRGPSATWDPADDEDDGS